MKILVVATKPPWPARDGGRLVLWHTLRGLHQAGHDIALIAPASADVDAAALETLRSICTPQLVPVKARGWPAAAALAWRRGQSLSVARHWHAALEHAVSETVGSWRPDVIHAEQLQALANTTAAQRAGVPVVLRMQNVESSLWQQVGAARRFAWPLKLEARRLRRDEQRALHSAACSIALTARDAEALAAIASADARISAVAPAFPAELPAAYSEDSTPRVCVAGSAGWWPNRQALDWLLTGVAPRLAAQGLPLQVFGGDDVSRPGLRWQPAPADSVDAFPAGAIAAVPLLIGSGLRMRILEAWARGLPVVASGVAAAGLEVRHGRELLIADTPDEFAAALLQLAAQPEQRAALIEAGRDYLRRQHDQARCTELLLGHYTAAVSSQH